MDWTDEEAVLQVRSGNPDAFRVLVDRHSRAIFRLAYRMTGNQQDAEDAVQETFLRAFRQLRLFDSRSTFSTWLYRICTNCTIDSLRVRKKHQEKRMTESETGELPILERQPAAAPSPERLTESSQIAGLLEPALAQLSTMERTAFVMRHYEGLAIEEIGRILDVRPNAAKHSVFRAVQKLRRALEPIAPVRTQIRDGVKA
jgi:RNA polymerase sigma-70 factor, ECF subfamily